MRHLSGPSRTRLTSAIAHTIAAAVAAAAAAVPLPADDADDVNHCEGTGCGLLYINAIQRGLSLAPADASGILAIGTFPSGSQARNTLTGARVGVHGTWDVGHPCLGVLAPAVTKAGCCTCCRATGATCGASWWIQLLVAMETSPGRTGTHRISYIWEGR